jgi:hypothetical protein
MQRQKYSALDEESLMASLWSKELTDDPEAFVLFAYPWGQAGTPLEGFKGPRSWQRGFLREMGEYIRSTKFHGSVGLPMEVLQTATASGRGPGKSALVSWLVHWMLTTRIGSTAIVSANTESQLRTVTWGELTKWITMAINSHWWEPSATKLQPAQWLTELVERDLQKGTRYWGAEGKLWSEENPDGYAGAHNMAGMMVVFDEASGIPDSIWSVANGFFTENIPDRYWLAFSNPRRNTGYFFECFHSKRSFWRTRQIDSRTVEGVDKGVYQKIIEEYGEDSNEAKIEVYGEFPTIGDDQFISPLWVDEAMKRPLYKDPTAPIVMGVDPARGGADSTVIAVRQGRDLRAILRYKGDDTMTTVGRVIEAMEEYHPQLTVIDEGGLGYGVLDRLKEQNYRVRGVNFGWKSSKPAMWGNRRAEMWGAMKDWLRTASVPTDRLLKQDFIGPTKKPNSAGVIFLEGKKEMKARGLASPDAADAIAVTFAYPVAPKVVQIDAPRVTHYSDEAPIASWMGC